MGHFRSAAALAVLGLILGTGNRAKAEELIRWFGFGTVGLAKSSSSVPYWRGVITRQTTFDVDTKFGLNATAEVSESLSATAQLLARGSANFYKAEADWVFVSFKPSNNLTINAGKQRLPVSLLSDQPDVGVVQPWIRPPDEFYLLNTLTTFIGPALRLGHGGHEWELSAELFAGSAISNRRFVGTEERDTAKELIGANVRFTREKLFTLQASFTRADVAVTVQSTTGSVILSVPGNNFKYFTAGLRSEMRQVVLLAEYSRSVGEDPLLGTIKSGYATLGYRFGEIFLPHFTYAAINSDQPPPNNPGEQHSLIAGVKATLNPRVAIKAQWQSSTVESGLGFFSSNPGTEAVHFLGASVDFVF